MKLKSILDIFESIDSDNYDALNDLYWRIRGYGDFEISEASSSDIKEFLKKLWNVRGNFSDNDRVKSEILENVLKQTQGDAIKEFLLSKDFGEFYDLHGEEYHYKDFVNSIYGAMGEVKASELFQNVPKFEKAKLYLRSNRFYMGFRQTLEQIEDLIQDSEHFDSKSFASLLDYLELYVATKGIDVDFQIFKDDEGRKSFIDSKEVRKLINEYYGTLTQEEKADFVNDLGFEPYGFGRRERIFYDNRPKEMKKAARIFGAIENDEKYEVASLNLLAGALEFDCVPEEKRLETFFRFIQIEDDYALKYLQDIKNGQHSGFDFNEELLESFAENESGINERYILAFLNNAPPEVVYDYLKKKPGEIGVLANVLPEENVNELLESYSTDEAYKARILFSIECDAKTVAKYFPHIEDDFVKAQLVISKNEVENVRFISVEDSLTRIDEYLRVKQQFLELPEEERTDFLCGLKSDEELDNPNREAKDRNETKKSLLKYIKNADDRKRVIESFENYIEPDIKEYADLTQKMIWEYMTENFELTDNQREMMQIVFRENDIYYTDYLESGTNAKCRYQEKDVTVANHSRGDTKNIILNMIHEYSHAFSNMNYMTTAYHVGHVFEEGMADTFSEQVANFYFQKYRAINIEDQFFEPELPLLNSSSYYDENGWVKSMLYPLEANGDDKRAMQSFLLGDKIDFFELALGEGFTDKFEKNYMGRPIEVSFSAKDLAEANLDAFCDLDTGSMYMLRNNRIKELSETAENIRGRNTMVVTVEEQKIRFRRSFSCYICTNERYGA